MYTSKLIIPIETLTGEEIDDLEQTFGKLNWVSDKIVMIDHGPTKVNPVDAWFWPPKTRIVLSWEVE